MHICLGQGSNAAANDAHGLTHTVLDRLCELLLRPQQHYRSLRKFKFACEMLLLVSDEVPLQQQCISASKQEVRSVGRWAFFLRRA
eukprot:COSAG01_NODE_6631_length_3570_cov_7.946989_2_plen_86_part_00